MKKIFTAFIASIGFSTASQAAMTIEPYLGYSSGELKYTYTSTFGGTEGKSTSTSTGYGLRLGYQFIIPYLALDYTGTTGKCKDDTTSYDCTGTQLGVVVGARLPIVKPYVGYGFSNELKIKGDTGDTTYKGTYTKVGLGLGFIPIVTLNIEYQINDYSKIDMSGTSYSKSELYSDLKATTTMISISYPISF